MWRLQAALRQLAQQSANDKQDLKRGVITSVDPTTHAVKVMIQPEGEETGWIQLGTGVTGNGTGLFLLPLPGTQVAVDYEQGHPEAGVAQHGVCDDNNRPPAGYQAGELWYVNKAGNLFKATNVGQITLVAPHGFQVTAETAIQGSLSVSGNVMVGNGASGSFTTIEGLTITVQDGIVTNIY